LQAIAERFQMDSESVLDNVICARAHNSEQQMELLADAAVSSLYPPQKADSCFSDDSISRL
jgi:Rad51